MPAEPLFPNWASRVELTLDRVLQNSAHSSRLDAAMRHAALGGGKRLRPMLVYATGAAFGASEDSLDAPAAAVELIHVFSLVHDDLPAMDDDDLRRGRPTVHVAFDVATAILAGDALQALAFQVLADAPLDPEIRIALVRELAIASGAAGMCAGQDLDMTATGAQVDLPTLEKLHSLKTGALIRAAVRMGALSARAPETSMRALDEFASALGLAFQIRDDLLDVESSSTQLGKTAGKDQAQGKSTYPALLGVAKTNEKLLALSKTMQSHLDSLGSGADQLRKLADFSIARVN